MMDDATVFIGGTPESIAKFKRCRDQCGWLGSCKCDIQKTHSNPKCRFRVSATCPIPIECDHGRDVCPECDPCDCTPPVKREGIE